VQAAKVRLSHEIYRHKAWNHTIESASAAIAAAPAELKKTIKLPVFLEEAGDAAAQLEAIQQALSELFNNEDVEIELEQPFLASGSSQPKLQELQEPLVINSVQQYHLLTCSTNRRSDVFLNILQSSWVYVQHNLG